MVLNVIAISIPHRQKQARHRDENEDFFPTLTRFVRSFHTSRKRLFEVIKIISLIETARRFATLKIDINDSSIFIVLPEQRLFDAMSGPSKIQRVS
jgi:hypothetical protein